MVDRFFDALAEWTVRRRAGVLVLMVAATALAVWWWPNFRFQPDVSRLLPVDNPVVQLNNELEKHTSESRLLFLDLRGEDLESRLGELVRRLGASPNILEVHAEREAFVGVNWPLIRQAPLSFIDIDGLDVLADRLTGDERDQVLRERRAKVAAQSVVGMSLYVADPLGLQELLEEQVNSSVPVRLKPDSPYVVLEGDKRAFVRVLGLLDSLHVEFSSALLAELRDIVKEVIPDGTVRFIGEYERSDRNMRLIRKDLRTSLITSIILVTLFLVISMRRLIDPLIIFVPVLLAVFWTLPYGGTFFGPMTPLTISGAALLIGLGADFAIHYVVRYNSERRGNGHGASVHRTVGAIGRPLLASMLTSVVAFLSLSRAEFTGLRVFGLLLALGLLLAFVASLLGLPLLLSVRPNPGGATRDRVWIRALDRFAASKVGRGVAVALLAMTAVGFGFALFRGVDFQSDLEFARTNEPMFADTRQDFEAELGFAITPVVLLVPQEVDPTVIGEGVQTLVQDGAVRFSDGPHLAFPASDRRAALERFESRTEGWVEGVMTELSESGYPAPLFRPGLSKFKSLFAADLSEWKSEEVMLGKTRYQRVFLFPRHSIETEEDWAVFSGAVESQFDETCLIFHPQALLDEVGDVLIADLFRAAAITAVLCALLVAFLSGGIKPGLFALLPTLSGFGLTLGTLSVTGSSLNMGNCVVVPLLLGIGVDHGIHLVAHFRDSGGRALGSCGVAIWRSSATSILGFGALIVASAPGIASMGWIAILGVGACLLTSLIVLPALWPKSLERAPE